MSRPTSIVCWWARNDLRLHDNPCLAHAAKLVSQRQCAYVLPIYILDPRLFGTTPFGSSKTGAYRVKFLLESLSNLKSNLRGIGSDLLIKIGKPEQILPTLISDGSVIVTQTEVTSEELQIDALVSNAIKDKSSKLIKLWGSTLYHIDDLPFAKNLADMPDVFTPFREQVERRCKVRDLVPNTQPGYLPLPPNLQDVDYIPQWKDIPFEPPILPPDQNDKLVLPFEGGESIALRRLKYYLWDTDHVAHYFDTRNEMLGADGSTKFAPWLSNGCLSPRKIYHELQAYEKDRAKNKSTYWVVFELIWRDYFRFYSLKHGNSIFKQGGVIRSKKPWNKDYELFQRWCKGQTGMPLVDACMRELTATGWMSNRGRQNVASYLALDLKLDWRRGADYFESLLLDYDVCSNWGNWVAAAGLTGGRVNLFNITKQSHDYDPKGDYIKHWVPELSKVPAPYIFEPWLLTQDQQRQYNVIIGKDYPRPANEVNNTPYARDSGPVGRGRGRNNRGGRVQRRPY
eukprot:NODE_1981_length_1729_cov_39.123910_g1689_i0.p1 GENE.NODE_1981_length_1729_cov_39.123910_g1689_i0~~NODE_1981_length_1729_cov_39.123910_g1689_i0.p1  ORF type:complete len:513 (+),score=56.38 NODE_1981_length_1729_cov_39.123910_g1689_i0:49-1587(+)